MKTNLLLLDSYKNMESMVAYAFSFSHRTNRQLKIVYVFDFEWMRQSYAVGSASVADPVLVNVQSNARKEFEDAEAKIRNTVKEYLKKHSVDVPVDIQVSDKNRIDLMLHETDEHPDLLLMVSNHQSYAEASGGVMGYPNLIYHMKCPVFVIPDNSKYAVLKNIVYATNFHPEDIEALKHLGRLLNTPDLSIAVLHNAKDAGFEEELKWAGFLELAKQATGTSSFVPVVKNEKKTLQAIEGYVGENDPDLIVVLKEKKGFFKEIFNTSNTRNVLTHFRKPVLVYHEK